VDLQAAGRKSRRGVHARARGHDRRTELGFAYNQGAVQNYAAVGVEKVVVRDGGTGGSCEACDAVDGEVWTLEEAAANPLEHPNCTRGFLPYVEDEQEEAA
jgi:hypothetical protein